METSDFPRISVAFRANDEASAKVRADFPLVLSVSMINESAIQASSQNAPFEDQIRELEGRLEAGRITEQEFRDAVEGIKRGMIKVRTYRLGGPEGWPRFIRFQALTEDAWSELDWPLWLLLYYPREQVVDLDGSTSCYVEFGLDPEDPKRPAGEFQTRAVVEISRDVVVESNVVEIGLLEEATPKAERGKEEYLLARGRYAYKRGLYDEAMGYAKGTLKANPGSIPSLQLQAEIEKARGNLPEALAAYEKALKAFTEQKPDIREPPRVFISEINRLRATLKEKQT